MALLWGVGVLLASCAPSGLGGFLSGVTPERREGTSGARKDDVGTQRPWDDRTCSWPVLPTILRGGQPVSLKDAAWGSQGFPARLRVSLEVEGDRLLLDLVQNRELLAGTQGLVYYLPDGERAMHPTSTEGNCCYRGKIQGYRDSWANVCVCSGLSGLLVVSSDRSYSLESSTEEDQGSRAYRLESVRQESGECVLVSLSRGQFHPRPQPEPSWLKRAKREAEPERGFVELVMVADKAEFELNPDLNWTRTRMLEIASHMDGFYRTVGLRVALVGLEVWNKGDRISVDGPPRAVLERLLRWRQEELLPRIPHDSVQLIMGSPFTGGSIGTATQGSICSHRSGGVSMDHSVSPLMIASTLSHQLGHNLGLGHDGAGCSCDGSGPNFPPGRSCIMEPLTGLLPGLTFSSCSHRKLQEILQTDHVWCLLDVPDPGRLVDSRCGNFLVEDKEECDCGLLVECTDPCCNASSCKLMPGAQCATGGACCHECKLRSAGFLCREAQNECDLPEFCDGTSPRCQANVHKQDGMPCGGEKATCYGGVCPNYLSQCQELWGPGSVPVSDTCVASLNVRGDLEGHCGQQANGSYLPCSERDAFCGRLQCQPGSTNATKQNRTTRTPECPHRTPTPVDDILDVAMVLPGTSCGAGKVCVDQRCRDLSSLKLPGCQCNGHGVCNSKGHCHCQSGWAPPNCLSSGSGGSIDSGPAAMESRGSATSTALVLTALLLVLVLCLGICCTKRVGLHKRLWQIGKGTSCQYRITHPEPRSYSQAPPERPRPPQFRQNTELQLMPASKPAVPDASRPEPPSKPLPPDPIPKGQQASVQDRPAPPTRPLPADPIPKDAQPPAKPPPPQKPLPSDPPRAELCAVPNYDPRVKMLPSRPAPPPPPPSLHIHNI